MSQVRAKILLALLNGMIWVVLILILLFFSLAADGFFSTSNFINILLHASILGVLVLGQAICLLSGNFDLSAEGTVSLLTVLAAWLMLPSREAQASQLGGIGWELSPFLVISLMIITGTLIGALVGTTITRLRMNNFIVTLAFQLILRGIALVVSMGAVLAGTPETFNWLGGGRLGPLPYSVIVTSMLFLLTGLALKNTRFGRELYAVGGNPHAARASGFNPEMTITKAYMVSGLMAALAAWMLLGRLETTTSTLGRGLTLETVAAAVIGGVALTGGVGTIKGVLGGVLVLSVIDNGLNLMDVNPFLIQGVRGLIILVALLVDAQKIHYGRYLA